MPGEAREGSGGQEMSEMPEVVRGGQVRPWEAREGEGSPGKPGEVRGGEGRSGRPGEDRGGQRRGGEAREAEGGTKINPPRKVEENIVHDERPPQADKPQAR